jgi:MOSC domain-containing protein
MELAEVVGQLAGLRRFPVRSLGGELPNECIVQGSGLAGDRIYDLFDEAEGVALSSLTVPFLLRYRARFLDPTVRGKDLAAWIRVRMPDGVERELGDPAWLEDIAKRCGRRVRLRPREDVDTELAPLHVLSVQTVRFVEKQYGGPLEPARFRSNLLLDLPDGRPFEEDRWIGRQIWIGDALLEIVRQCERSIVPSLDADTPERSPGILAAIVRGRGGMIGVSARAIAGNRLRVGDPVAIVD